MLVLGMHRSGTSALTRVLSLLGASLPKEILGASEGNETGHWEPARFLQLHERLLAEMGSAWHDWRRLDLTRLPAARRKELKAEISGIVNAEYGDAPLFVIKEPRICRMASFFIEALEEAGISVAPVISLRNPLEVVASLQKRSDWPAERSAAEAGLLWLSHVLESERATRGRPRAIVAYDALVTDWKAVMRSVVRQTGLTLPATEDEAAPLVGEFLNTALRHHERTATEAALDPVTRGWTSDAYEAMVKLSVNPEASGPLGTLDRVRAGFEAAAPVMDQMLAAANKARHEAEQRAEAQAAETQNLAGEVEQLRALQQSGAREGEELRRQLEAAQGEPSARVCELEGQLRESETRANALRETLADAQARIAEADAARADQEQLRAMVTTLDRSLTERDSTMDEIRTALGVDSGDNRSLPQLIGDLGETLAGHEKEIERAEQARREAETRIREAEESATEAAAAMGEKDAALAAARKENAKAEAEIAARMADIENLRAELNRTHEAYRNSTSWKLTAPVRGVRRLVGGLRQGVGLTPTAISHGGGLLPATRKAIRISLTEGYSGVRDRIDVVKRIDEIHSPNPTYQEKQPLVSIIVPNYNHQKYLEKRLDTIYSQTYKNIEVILLDDCSKDKSDNILKRYNNEYSNITRYVRNKTNSGSGYRQWAKGMSMANGELIWIAESDDWSDLSFLERAVVAFNDEAVSFAYVNSSFVCEDGTREVWSNTEYLHDIDKNLWKNSFVLTAHQLVKLGWSKKNLVPNVSSAVFRHPGKENALIEGNWSNMKICGDWLLYLNIIKGGRVTYFPDKLNFYRIHDESTAKSTFSKDIYYSEHETVAQFILENFAVNGGFVNAQEKNLRTHWAQNRSDYTEQKFRNCYDISRIRASANSRRPNVLMCGYSFSAGGGETFPIFLANMLRKRGYSITFLSFEQEPRVEGIQKLLGNDIPVVKDFRNIKNIIKDFDIDILHSHHAWVDNTIIDLVEGSEKGNIVISTHGMYEGLPPHHQERIVRRIAEKSTAIVYTAAKNLEPFIKLDLDKLPKLFRIPNALQKTDINPVALKNFGVRENSFVLCMVARAIPEKGWQEAIEAVNLARQKSRIEIELLLIGDGEERQRLEGDCHESHIHFLGFRSNIRDYYAACDIGFLPTRFAGESYPLTLIDCLAAGKPVLASFVGEIPQMLKAGDQMAGVVFDLENWQIPIEQLSDTIVKLATDKQYYGDLVHSVPEANAKFDPELMVDRYEQVYKWSMENCQNAKKH